MGRAARLLIERGLSYPLQGGRYLTLRLYTWDEGETRLLERAFGGSTHLHLRAQREGQWDYYCWAVSKRGTLRQIYDAVSQELEEGETVRENLTPFFTYVEDLSTG